MQPTHFDYNNDKVFFSISHDYPTKETKIHFKQLDLSDLGSHVITTETAQKVDQLKAILPNLNGSTSSISELSIQTSQTSLYNDACAFPFYLHALHAITKIVAVALKMEMTKFRELDDHLISLQLCSPYTSKQWETIATDKRTFSFYLDKKTPRVIADPETELFLESKYQNEKGEDLIVFECGSSFKSHQNTTYYSYTCSTDNQSKFLEQVRWIISQLNENENGYYAERMLALIDQFQNQPSTTENYKALDQLLENNVLSIENLDKIMQIITPALAEAPTRYDQIRLFRKFEKLSMTDLSPQVPLIRHEFKKTIKPLRESYSLKDELDAIDHTEILFKEAYPRFEYSHRQEEALCNEFKTLTPEEIHRLIWEHYNNGMAAATGTTCIVNSSPLANELELKINELLKDSLGNDRLFDLKFYKELLSLEKKYSAYLLQEAIQALNDEALFNLVTCLVYISTQTYCNRIPNNPFEKYINYLPPIGRIAYYFVYVTDYNREDVYNYEKYRIERIESCDRLGNCIQTTPFVFRLATFAALINSKLVHLSVIEKSGIISTENGWSLITPLIKRVNWDSTSFLTENCLKFKEIYHLRFENCSYFKPSILNHIAFKELKKLEIYNVNTENDFPIYELSGVDPRIYSLNVPPTLINLTTLQIQGNFHLNIPNLPKLTKLMLFNNARRNVINNLEHIKDLSLYNCSNFNFNKKSYNFKSLDVRHCTNLVFEIELPLIEKLRLEHSYGFTQGFINSLQENSYPYLKDFIITLHFDAQYDRLIDSISNHRSLESAYLDLHDYENGLVDIPGKKAQALSQKIKAMIANGTSWLYSLTFSGMDKINDTALWSLLAKNLEYKTLLDEVEMCSNIKKRTAAISHSLFQTNKNETNDYLTIDVLTYNTFQALKRDKFNALASQKTSELPL